MWERIVLFAYLCTFIICTQCFLRMQLLEEQYINFYVLSLQMLMTGNGMDV